MKKWKPAKRAMAWILSLAMIGGSSPLALLAGEIPAAGASEIVKEEPLAAAAPEEPGSDGLADGSLAEEEPSREGTIAEEPSPEGAAKEEPSQEGTGEDALSQGETGEKAPSQEGAAKEELSQEETGEEEPSRKPETPEAVQAASETDGGTKPAAEGSVVQGEAMSAPEMMPLELAENQDGNGDVYVWINGLRGDENWSWIFSDEDCTLSLNTDGLGENNTNFTVDWKIGRHVDDNTYNELTDKTAYTVNENNRITLHGDVLARYYTPGDGEENYFTLTCIVLGG